MASCGMFLMKNEKMHAFICAMGNLLGISAS